MVQWLGLWALTAKGLGSIPGMAKKKKKSLPGLIIDDLFIRDLTSDRSLSHLGSISGPPWKAAVGQGNA